MEGYLFVPEDLNCVPSDVWQQRYFILFPFCGLKYFSRKPVDRNIHRKMILPTCSISEESGSLSNSMGWVFGGTIEIVDVHSENSFSSKIRCTEDNLDEIMLYTFLVEVRCQKATTKIRFGSRTSKLREKWITSMKAFDYEQTFMKACMESQLQPNVHYFEGLKNFQKHVHFGNMNLKSNMNFFPAIQSFLNKRSPFGIIIACLELVNVNLQDHHANQLSSLLRLMPYLIKLNLSRNNISIKGIPALVDAFSVFQSDFHELDISYNPLGNEGVLLLLPVLSNCPKIRSLSLASTGMTSNAVSELVYYMSPLTSCLEVLDLSYNQLGNEGSALAAYFLIAHPCRLVSLNISFIQLSSQGLLELSRHLPMALSTLRYLGLQGLFQVDNLAWNSFFQSIFAPNEKLFSSSSSSSTSSRAFSVTPFRSSSSSSSASLSSSSLHLEIGGLSVAMSPAKSVLEFSSSLSLRAWKSSMTYFPDKLPLQALVLTRSAQWVHGKPWILPENFISWNSQQSRMSSHNSSSQQLFPSSSSSASSSFSFSSSNEKLVTFVKNKNESSSFPDTSLSNLSSPRKTKSSLLERSDHGILQEIQCLVHFQVTLPKFCTSIFHFLEILACEVKCDPRQISMLSWSPWHEDNSGNRRGDLWFTFLDSPIYPSLPWAEDKSPSLIPFSSPDRLAHLSPAALSTILIQQGHQAGASSGSGRGGMSFTHRTGLESLYVLKNRLQKEFDYMLYRTSRSSGDTFVLWGVHEASIYQPVSWDPNEDLKLDCFHVSFERESIPPEVCSYIPPPIPQDEVLEEYERQEKKKIQDELERLRKMNEDSEHEGEETDPETEKNSGMKMKLSSSSTSSEQHRQLSSEDSFHASQDIFIERVEGDLGDLSLLKRSKDSFSSTLNHEDNNNMLKSRLEKVSRKKLRYFTEDMKKNKKRNPSYRRGLDGDVNRNDVEGDSGEEEEESVRLIQGIASPELEKLMYEKLQWKKKYNDVLIRVFRRLYSLKEVSSFTARMVEGALGNKKYRNHLQKALRQAYSLPEKEGKNFTFYERAPGSQTSLNENLKVPLCFLPPSARKNPPLFTEFQDTSSRNLTKAFIFPVFVADEVRDKLFHAMIHRDLSSISFFMRSLRNLLRPSQISVRSSKSPLRPNSQNRSPSLSRANHHQPSISKGKKSTIKASGRDRDVDEEVEDEGEEAEEGEMEKWNSWEENTNSLAYRYASRLRSEILGLQRQGQQLLSTLALASLNLPTIDQFLLEAAELGYGGPEVREVIRMKQKVMKLWKLEVGPIVFAQRFPEVQRRSYACNLMISRDIQGLKKLMESAEVEFHELEVVWGDTWKLLSSSSSTAATTTSNNPESQTHSSAIHPTTTASTSTTTSTSSSWRFSVLLQQGNSSATQTSQDNASLLGSKAQQDKMNQETWLNTLQQVEEKMEQHFWNSCEAKLAHKILGNYQALESRMQKLWKSSQGKPLYTSGAASLFPSSFPYHDGQDENDESPTTSTTLKKEDSLSKENEVYLMWEEVFSWGAYGRYLPPLYWECLHRQYGQNNQVESQLLEPLLQGWRHGSAAWVTAALQRAHHAGWHPSLMDYQLATRVLEMRAIILEEETLKSRLIRASLAIKNGIDVKPVDILNLKRRMESIRKSEEEDSNLAEYFHILDQYLKKFKNLLQIDQSVQKMINNRDIAGLIRLLAGRGHGKLMIAALDQPSYHQWFQALEEVCELSPFDEVTTSGTSSLTTTALAAKIASWSWMGVSPDSLPGDIPLSSVRMVGFLDKLSRGKSNKGSSSSSLPNPEGKGTTSTPSASTSASTSASSRWQRRFFILHDSFLSYYHVTFSTASSSSSSSSLLSVPASSGSSLPLKKKSKLKFKGRLRILGGHVKRVQSSAPATSSSTSSSLRSWLLELEEGRDVASISADLLEQARALIRVSQGPTLQRNLEMAVREQSKSKILQALQDGKEVGIHFDFEVFQAAKTCLWKLDRREFQARLWKWIDEVAPEKFQPERAFLFQKKLHEWAIQDKSPLTQSVENIFRASELGQAIIRASHALRSQKEERIQAAFQGIIKWWKLHVNSSKDGFLLSSSSSSSSSLSSSSSSSSHPMMVVSSSPSISNTSNTNNNVSSSSSIHLLADCLDLGQWFLTLAGGRALRAVLEGDDISKISRNFQKALATLDTSLAGIEVPVYQPLARHLLTFWRQNLEGRKSGEDLEWDLKQKTSKYARHLEEDMKSSSMIMKSMAFEGMNLAKYLEFRHEKDFMLPQFSLDKYPLLRTQSKPSSHLQFFKSMTFFNFSSMMSVKKSPKWKEALGSNAIVNEFLTFTKKSLKESLLILTPEKKYRHEVLEMQDSMKRKASSFKKEKQRLKKAYEKSQQLTKEMFEAIQVFMGDKELSSCTFHATKNFIFRLKRTSREEVLMDLIQCLRRHPQEYLDELCMQLAKQLSGNPSIHSCYRGWLLWSVLSHCLVPSRQILPYLHHFFAFSLASQSLVLSKFDEIRQTKTEMTEDKVKNSLLGVKSVQEGIENFVQPINRALTPQEYERQQLHRRWKEEGDLLERCLQLILLGMKAFQRMDGIYVSLGQRKHSNRPTTSSSTSSSWHPLLLECKSSLTPSSRNPGVKREDEVVAKEEKDKVVDGEGEVEVDEEEVDDGDALAYDPEEGDVVEELLHLEANQASFMSLELTSLPLCLHAPFLTSLVSAIPAEMSHGCCQLRLFFPTHTSLTLSFHYGEHPTLFSLLPLIYQHLVPSPSPILAHWVDHLALFSPDTSRTAWTEWWTRLFHGYAFYFVEQQELQPENGQLKLPLSFQANPANRVPWDMDLSWEVMAAAFPAFPDQSVPSSSSSTSSSSSRAFPQLTLIFRRECEIHSLWPSLSTVEEVMGDIQSPWDEVGNRSLWKKWLADPVISSSSSSTTPSISSSPPSTPSSSSSSWAAVPWGLEIPEDSVRVDLMFAEEANRVGQGLYSLPLEALAYLSAIQLALEDWDRVARETSLNSSVPTPLFSLQSCFVRSEQYRKKFHLSTSFMDLKKKSGNNHNNLNMNTQNCYGKDEQGGGTPQGSGQGSGGGGSSALTSSSNYFRRTVLAMEEIEEAGRQMEEYSRNVLDPTAPTAVPAATAATATRLGSLRVHDLDPFRLDEEYDPEKGKKGSGDTDSETSISDFVDEFAARIWSQGRLQQRKSAWTTSEGEEGSDRGSDEDEVNEEEDEDDDEEEELITRLERSRSQFEIERKEESPAGAWWRRCVTAQSSVFLVKDLKYVKKLLKNILPLSPDFSWHDSQRKSSLSLEKEEVEEEDEEGEEEDEVFENPSLHADLSSSSTSSTSLMTDMFHLPRDDEGRILELPETFIFQVAEKLKEILQLSEHHWKVSLDSPRYRYFWKRVYLDYLRTAAPWMGAHFGHMNLLTTSLGTPLSVVAAFSCQGIFLLESMSWKVVFSTPLHEVDEFQVEVATSSSLPCLCMKMQDLEIQLETAQAWEFQELFQALCLERLTSPPPPSSFSGFDFPILNTTSTTLAGFFSSEVLGGARDREVSSTALKSTSSLYTLYDIDMNFMQAFNRHFFQLMLTYPLIPTPPAVLPPQFDEMHFFARPENLHLRTWKLEKQRELRIQHQVWKEGQERLGVFEQDHEMAMGEEENEEDEEMGEGVKGDIHQVEWLPSNRLKNKGSGNGKGQRGVLASTSSSTTTQFTTSLATTSIPFENSPSSSSGCVVSELHAEEVKRDLPRLISLSVSGQSSNQHRFFHNPRNFHALPHSSSLGNPLQGSSGTSLDSYRNPRTHSTPFPEEGEGNMGLVMNDVLFDTPSYGITQVSLTGLRGVRDSSQSTPPAGSGNGSGSGSGDGREVLFPPVLTVKASGSVFPSLSFGGSGETSSTATATATATTSTTSAAAVPASFGWKSKKAKKNGDAWLAASMESEEKVSMEGKDKDKNISWPEFLIAWNDERKRSYESPVIRGRFEGLLLMATTPANAASGNDGGKAGSHSHSKAGAHANPSSLIRSVFKK